MTMETYSFVYARDDALLAFQKTGTEGLMMALLARMPPRPEWDGCLVYEGDSPEGGQGGVCIGIRGPGAEQVQLRLMEQLEQFEIPVRQAYEGGPEVRRELARASGERWSIQ